MGMRIGDIGGNAPGALPPLSSNSISMRESGHGYRQASGDSESMHAGFGENTISPPAMVLQTIGKNFRGVRQLVQNVERLRAESKARRVEQEAAREEQIRRAAEVVERLNEVRIAFPAETAEAGSPTPNMREEQMFRPQAAPEVRQFAETSPAPSAEAVGMPPETPIPPDRLDLSI
jgi:hypothetical protein